MKPERIKCTVLVDDALHKNKTIRLMNHDWYHNHFRGKKRSITGTTGTIHIESIIHAKIVICHT